MALALRTTPLATATVPERRPQLTAVPAPCAPRPPRQVPAEPPNSARDASVRMLYPPVDAGPAAPLRLTGRGVLVLSVLAGMLCAGLLAVAAWSAATARAGAQPRSGTASVVTVRSGDTLWSIAGRVAPNVDPRAEVALLQRVNRLPGARLVPGQRLRLG